MQSTTQETPLDVERILLAKGKTQYYVKWKGKSIFECTWVSKKNLPEKDLNYFEQNIRKKIPSEYQDGTIPKLVCKQIVGEKETNNEIFYRTEWQNFVETTWEPATSVPKMLIDKFKQHTEVPYGSTEDLNDIVKLYERDRSQVKIVKYMARDKEIVLMTIRSAYNELAFPFFKVREKLPQLVIDYLIQGIQPHASQQMVE